MKVRIYKPAKSAMQSGRASENQWLLEYETLSPRVAEPLMGWTASGDTLNQVRLRFSTQEAALAFAEKKGWDYACLPPQERMITPRNYIDNFRLDCPRPYVGRSERDAADKCD